jgi:hypothetical protein
VSGELLHPKINIEKVFSSLDRPQIGIENHFLCEGSSESARSTSYVDRKLNDFCLSNSSAFELQVFFGERVSRGGSAPFFALSAHR